MTINVSKLKTNLHKKQISTEITEPTNAISAGNMALNYIMTGDFYRGMFNKRTTMYVGPSNSGKSLLAAIAAKKAQDAGYFIVYIDTEHAIDEKYFTRIGINMDDEHFLPISVSTVEDIAEVFSVLMRQSNEDDKIFLAIDSLGNIETTAEATKFEEDGTMQIDQGLRAKRVKQLMRNINNKVGLRDMFVTYTNHVYQSQEQYGEEYKVAHGDAVMYIPSTTVLLKGLKPKKGEVGKDFVGFRMKATCKKTRFTSQEKSTELNIPYETGLDPIDGLYEFIEDEKLIEKSGAWCYYPVGADKEQQKKFQKADFNQELFDDIISENERMKKEGSSGQDVKDNAV